MVIIFLMFAVSAMSEENRNKKFDIIVWNGILTTIRYDPIAGYPGRNGFLSKRTSAGYLVTYRHVQKYPWLPFDDEGPPPGRFSPELPFFPPPV
ncbi:hypothetical protein F5Y16DRAFT_228817 [Xylariaceae sp. FL0255]|nr:hypothetical protein F5Y16DRAFT_228817 [Xylariaceae sp. FL0255]